MIWFGSAAAAAIVSALASIATTAVNRHYQNRDRDKDNTHQLARLEKEHVQQLARLKQEHDQQLIRDQKADAQALRDKRSARLREIYPVILNGTLLTRGTGGHRDRYRDPATAGQATRRVAQAGARSTIRARSATA